MVKSEGGTGLLDRLEKFRQEAWKRFEALPWPTKTDEEWRRTDPGEFRLSEADLKPPSDPRWSLPILAKARTSTKGGNDHFTVGWDDLPPTLIQEGVIVTDLDTALQQFPELVEEHLFKSGTPQGLPKYIALHEALWSPGIFCYIPEGVRVEIPLKISAQATRGNAAIFPHTLLVVGPGAQVTIIDERRSHGVGAEPLFVDEMVEIVIQEGASLRYLHLQRWNLATTQLYTQRAVLKRDAQFFNLLVGLGSRLTKAQVETELSEPGSRSDLLGVFFEQADQHFDFHTLQDHRAPHTTSDLLYKSALKDRSQSIYTGLIRIRKEAQKSDAYQANRNLLLSQGSKADSVPMLEIEADDVRCTHGVAVGPVDEEQAFYLMSRGLPKAEAECLIVEGFFDQVFKKIPIESLREQLFQEVAHRLNGEEAMEWASG